MKRVKHYYVHEQHKSWQHTGINGGTRVIVPPTWEDLKRKLEEFYVFACSDIEKACREMGMLMSPEDELKQYEGTPKCMDCKWKLDSDITNNCPCKGGKGDKEQFESAIKRARELQDIVNDR